MPDFSQDTPTEPVEQSLPEAVHELARMARFHMDRQGAYEVGDVDGLLNEVEKQAAGESLTDQDRAALLALIDGTRFRMSKRIGYRVADVDSVIAEITRQLS